ncbi:MAG: alpha-galactosidase [Ruminococcus sp.]|nr:alpha-galactosidase [Ruminococcus sp.]
MGFETGRFKIDTSFPMNCDVKTLFEEDGVQCTLFDFQYEKETNKGERKIAIDFSFPILDIVGKWHPVCAMDRAVKPDWFPGAESMASISAPVMCFYNGDSENKHTVALSEIKQKVTMKYGVHEEDGTMLCHTEMVLPRDSFLEGYQLKIWESVESEPYWSTLAKVSKWWETDHSLKVMQVPDCARDTLYSFWYSQHQEVTAKSVEDESRLAAKLGFSSIIVDDGWQTDDNNRGYSFCGDWEPAVNKFPDFAGHVKKVQGMGLKYMIWFSIPFVGKKAKVWDRFKDKILCYDDFQQAAVLDLRYPDVREYLKDIYKKAVREWGIDGLKLDFIDEFYLRPETPKYQEGMDYIDLQDALDVFLTEVMEELSEIRSDIMIEFRQKYIGPQIRKYGNLLRVMDCPNSGISNRVGTVDLRLLSGNTAVHSDMLMWNKDEKPEDAALQIISCLFATVQVSVDLSKISEENGRMLSYWMEFMKEHVSVLQTAQIQPLEPENLYPQVMTEDEKERIQVNYSKGRVVDLCTIPETFYYVHGTKADKVVFKMDEKQSLSWKVLDCMGNEVDNGCWCGERWAEVSVPTAGTVVIVKK